MQIADRRKLAELEGAQLAIRAGETGDPLERRFCRLLAQRMVELVGDLEDLESRSDEDLRVQLMNVPRLGGCRRP